SRVGPDAEGEIATVRRKNERATQPTPRRANVQQVLSRGGFPKMKGSLAAGRRQELPVGGQGRRPDVLVPGSGGLDPGGQFLSSRYVPEARDVTVTSRDKHLAV